MRPSLIAGEAGVAVALRWFVVALAGVGAFAASWAVFHLLLDVDEGMASAWAGLAAAIVMAPLTVWASRDRVSAVRSDPIADAPTAPVARAPYSASKLPLRNPNFTGREDLLNRLRNALSARSALAVQTLHGLAGVGKTQLASEYSHRYFSDYDLIGWIHSERSALIPEQVAALAPSLSISLGADIPATAAAVVTALSHRSRWLLVFDNAERPEDIRPFLPHGSGHVIITSRLRGWSVLGGTIEVNVMPREDTKKLITRRVEDIPDDSADALGELLGDLPLAVEQAAAYLEQNGIPAGDYLALLRTRGEELLSRGRIHDYQHTLDTLWDVNRQQIETINPAAAQLLNLCAFLGPEPIPLDLFTTHPHILADPLASIVVDQIAFAETVGILINYSLARRNRDTITMHRLLASAIRHGLLPDQRRTAAETDLALLRADLPADVTRPEHWPRWRQLLPHVLTVTGHPEDSSTTHAPPSAWLLDRAASYLQTHGQLDQARVLFEQALRIDEAAYGPDHPEVASDLNNLALVLRDLGALDQALPLLERALRIDEATYGRDHPEVASDLNNLALVLRDLGALDRALPLLERALRIDETVGSADIHVATRLNSLGRVLRDLGQPDRAQPLLERALRIDEAALTPDHPAYSADLNSLALVLRDLGRLDQAQQLLERALRITEAAYGSEHPEVSADLNNLALVLRDLGELDRARLLLLRALRIAEAAYGPEHRDVAARLNNLSLVLQDLGKPDVSNPLRDRALRIVEAIHGPDHRMATMIRANLPILANRLGTRPLEPTGLVR